jgi:phosphatidylserine/phosphatidylglycerophosphate/cardiolipin synthase-like enzyme
MADAARWRAVLGPQTRAGNAVRATVDGPETFRDFCDAIRTAQKPGHYCYLLGWWLDDDVPLVAGDPASTIRSLFAALSAKGVQVRAMLWDQKFPKFLKNTFEVKRISALAHAAAILDDETPRFGSHHQKVLIVKGERGLIAFCGGVDINADRVVAASSGSSSGSAGAPLHDVHCRITGPAARDLLDTFVQRWRAHPLSPSIDASKGGLLGAAEPIPRPAGTSFVRVARTANIKTPLRCIRERGIRDVMRRAIASAQRFIYFEDQYLVSMEAARLLVAALPRIQHLTILVADASMSDMPQIWRRRKEFIDLLRRGPHAAKVRVAILAPPSAPHTYVHAKTWIIDDELAVIGSANCNRRGWSYDSEVIAAIFDRAPSCDGTPSFAQALRMRLWAEHLRVPPALLRDGVASASLWVHPPAGARIRPYDPNAGTDPLWQQPDFMFDSIGDPSGDGVPACPPAAPSTTRQRVLIAR